ncbi:BA14K family protein [Aquabacter cavernae]|uniref:BA14K family protein n=1 Tax=Aquabacter cavernae TaxID=2496029 RepID=UPI001FE0F23C|nr:BA14K family protein [Aquabacter cavernae]
MRRSLSLLTAAAMLAGVAAPAAQAQALRPAMPALDGASSVTQVQWGPGPGWGPGRRPGWGPGPGYGPGYGPPPGYYRNNCGWGGCNNNNNAGAAAAAGLVGGLILGAAAASAAQQAQQPPAVYYAPGPAADPNWIAYCSAKYRSFDPRTGTYLGYDGLRHPCQ